MSDLTVHHLLREHREVEKALGQLEALLEELEEHPDGRQEEREDFQWAIALVGRHLAIHMRKEEEILFPALEAFLPAEMGPLSVLRGEHADLRELFRLLQRAAEQHCKGDGCPDATQALQHYGDAVLQTARDHIYKEDRVLFPVISRFLSPERDAHLLAKMEGLDQKGATLATATDARPQFTSAGRRAPMTIDKKDILERLKLEAEFIEKGGYFTPSAEAGRAPRIFRDSVSCPNLGLAEKVVPCSHCFLMQFVPPDFRNAEDPCQHIPLNERGDTVAALTAAGEREKAHREVLGWLRRIVEQLEGEPTGTSK